MALKITLLCIAVCLSAAQAGFLHGAPVAYGHPGVAYGHPGVAYGHPGVAVASPALTSQSSNILRSFGNLGQVAHQSKTITTPFSSVTKSDVRVSNPGLAVGAVGYGYQAPVSYAHAAPVSYAHAAPVVAPAAHGLLGVAYSPATAVSHMTYHAPALGFGYGW